MGQLLLLYRRKQIGLPSYSAGLRYRAAWRAIIADGRPTTDIARERARAPSGGRLPLILAAREYLDRAVTLLGVRDDALVRDVAVFGSTIEEATGRLIGLLTLGRPTESDRRFVGQLFRSALQALASADDETNQEER